MMTTQIKGNSSFPSDGGFRFFVEAVKDYAIYTLDAQGLVTSWNQGAERIKGYSASEIIGRHFSCFFTGEDQRAGEPEREMLVAASQERFEADTWRVRKDGSRFWANVVLTAIKKDDGALAGFAKVTRDITERMRAQEALRQANAELTTKIHEKEAAERKLARSEAALRALSLHLLHTQDEERRRIGRELHDSLGQYLAMAKMNLDALELILREKGDELPRQLGECIRLVEDSVKEVRTISYLLYPPMLEEVGLKSAIAWYLEGFSKRSQIQITLEADPDFPRLGSEAELALFRILQESLTNVHRHSGSSSAEVHLLRGTECATLQIRDHGTGIPAKLLDEPGEDWLGSLGVGLRGMHERMRQLQGVLEISSNDHGTIVRADVPIKPKTSSSEQAFE